MLRHTSCPVLVFIVIPVVLVCSVKVTKPCWIYEKICNEESNGTCEECKSAHPCCVWITQRDVRGQFRCTIEDRLLVNGFNGAYSQGGYAKIDVLENRDFYEPNFGNDEPAIQIKPQKIKASLRRGENITFEIRYKGVADYPLDVYYLMDQTFSMRTHIRKVATLGEELSKKMKRLTKNYKIAFGSFSDKVRMPYVSMVPKDLENPCNGVAEVSTCNPGFDFIHFLNFTANIQDFIRTVKNSSYTANVDDLEGGLDAIMQIILCQQELEWRKYSRKIILVATDGLLHTAGSGVLGGIVNRLDFTECKLRNSGNVQRYDGLFYDYPSIEEVYKQLKKFKVNVLFMITEKYLKFYRQLHGIMSEVNSYGLLSDNSENILDLMETGYKNLIQQVAFRIVDEDPNVRVLFQSTCNAHETEDTNICSNVKLGQEYTFKVTLQLVGAVEDVTRRNLRIEEMNIKEFVDIELDFVEKCECNDTQEDFESHGHLECGKFLCDAGWSGEFCTVECNRDMGRLVNATYTSSTCFNRGDFDETVCKCICDADYYGQYCEYRQCPSNKRGEMCSNNGLCSNGQCICSEGYTGPLCDCVSSNATCIAPGDTKLCGGLGECVCGQCQCYDSLVSKRELCAFCKQCKYFCNLYEDVVVKVATKNATKSPPAQLMELDQVIFKRSKEELPLHKCLAEVVMADEKRCRIQYTYNIGTKVSIEYFKFCWTQMNTAVVGSVVAVAVVFIGLLAVAICKGYLMYKEKVEYAKFQEIINATEYREENALYKSPLTTYKNPINSQTSL